MPEKKKKRGKAEQSLVQRLESMTKAEALTRLAAIARKQEEILNKLSENDRGLFTELSIERAALNQKLLEEDPGFKPL